MQCLPVSRQVGEMVNGLSVNVYRSRACSISCPSITPVTSADSGAEYIVIPGPLKDTSALGGFGDEGSLLSIILPASAT